MYYKNTVTGKFIDRPNRFIAHVDIGGAVETVHVKNTGRCKELLLPGVEVILQKADDPNRKTQYDLISVYKASLGWVNIDSQVPNRVVFDWLKAQNFDYIKPEYTYGDSRIDFYMERDGKKYLLEVKGCTLEIDGVGYFPDAVSDRAAKHCRELSKAVQDGYESIIVFVIAMPEVTQVLPNRERDPAFADALKYAQDMGVRVINLPCIVTPDNIIPAESVKI